MAAVPPSSWVSNGKNGINKFLLMPPSSRLLPIIIGVITTGSLLHFFLQMTRVFSSNELTTDVHIFLLAGQQYLETGSLYSVFDDYAQGYAPGKAVYKFPPPYQLTLLPFITWISDFSEILFIQKTLYAILYLISIALLFDILRGKLNKLVMSGHISCPAGRVSAFFSVLVMLSAGYVYEALSWLEPELLILFFVALAFRWLECRPVLSGIMVACAAAVKIYPVFLVLYWVMFWNVRGLIGFLVGTVLILTISVLVFGWKEHVFYAQNILPVIVAESPTYKGINISLQSWIYTFSQLTAESAGYLVKTVVLMLLVGSRKLVADHVLHRPVYFCLLLSAMLLWIPNLWTQYLVLLLPTVLFLCASFWVYRRIIPLALCVFIVVILFIPTEWYYLPIQKIFLAYPLLDENIQMVFTGKMPVHAILNWHNAVPLSGLMLAIIFFGFR